jgi:PKD repeat protein
MNKLVVLLLAACCAGPGVSMAQEERGCATDQLHKLMLQKNPVYKAQNQKLEQEAQNFAATFKSQQNQRTFKQSDTIPVVFHIVYNTAQQNITEAQILSQLAVMNADFNRKNADTTKTPKAFQAVAGNPLLYFCLATLDPEGNPTSGITRTKTNRAAFDVEKNEMKFDTLGGHNSWNSELYLNIWVCNLSSEFLGFAQFPGGPVETDGIVLKFSSVGRFPSNPFPGSYNLGRTATHEIGHWLGLRHIWGDDEGSCSGSDLIEDTPNQADRYTGCPQFPQISCNNGPNGSMFMNYMDYTTDGCMNLFTQGQAAKMQSVLQVARKSILESNVCNNTLNADFRASTNAIMPGKAVDFFYYSNGRKPQSFNWTFEGAFPNTSTEQNPRNIRYDQTGSYKVTLTVTDAWGQKTKTTQGYIKVTNEDLLLYPNPANQHVSLEVPTGHKLRTVAVFNQLGQLIEEIGLNERSAKLDIRHLRNGLYFVRAFTDNGNYVSQQLIVTHNNQD